jgi:hypothetical protein
MLLGHMGQDCGDMQKEIPIIERVTEGGRQNRGNDSCQQLSLHLDPCHVLGKVSGVGFACDDSIASFGERGGGGGKLGLGRRVSEASVWKGKASYLG